MAENDVDTACLSQGVNTMTVEQAASLDFETALARLEGLVAQMESGNLPLEQSLAAYQQGVELARLCQQRLDVAEQQVKVLQGNLLKPFNDASDSKGHNS